MRPLTRKKSRAARTAISHHAMPASSEQHETWICPGPEWPPDEETCGRILNHDGRCEECTRRRTTLRKQAARIKRQLANPATATARTAGRGPA